MNQKDYSLIDKMRIKTDAVVVNQCQEDNSQEFIKNGHRIRWINSSTRGLSISRNICLENATADICLIADDDLEYLIHKDYRIQGLLNLFQKYIYINFYFVLLLMKCHSGKIFYQKQF